jgi:hypothetical protein
MLRSVQRHHWFCGPLCPQYALPDAVVLGDWTC